jgi:hypothetical protein
MERVGEQGLRWSRKTYLNGFLKLRYYAEELLQDLDKLDFGQIKLRRCSEIGLVNL